jgi:cytochrome P450
LVFWSPFSKEITANPYPVYRALRDEAPVYHNEELDLYALSRYDDVLAAHLDPETFSSAHGVTIEGIDAGMPFLLVKDQPEHTWHRKIVSRVFTPRRIADLEPFIRERAAALLDPHLEDGRLDVVEDYSMRLPLDVIGELIGIPVDLRADVHILSDRLGAREGEELLPEDAMAAMDDLRDLFAGLVGARRKAPGDDVISLLMQSPVEDGAGNERMLDDIELAYRFMELAFAGHETVAKLIPSGVVALAWSPEQRAELVASPALLVDATEELLRWDPPSQYQGRWSTRDVELHGVTIPAEKRVVLITGAAVHDERKYPDPELFDIHRIVDRHVSFGFGIHLCLGAAVARLETRIAFEELLARVPHYEIDERGVVRAYSSNVRGLQNLPITFEGTAART